MAYRISTRNNKLGHQIGYHVINADTGEIIKTFNNRDFGGVSFFRRAKDAADALVLDLNRQNAAEAVS